MHNPMTTEYVRRLSVNLSPLKLAFLEAVDNFSYQSAAPLESPLGEYSRDKYDRDALVNAVSLAIRKVTVSNGSRLRLDRLQLIKAIADAGFHPNTLNSVEETVEKEAIQMIDVMTEVKEGRQRFLMRNAHHGRQYLAAAVSESIVVHYNF